MTDEQALHLAKLLRDLKGHHQWVETVIMDSGGVLFYCKYRHALFTHDGPEEEVEETELYWDMKTPVSVDELKEHVP